MSNLPERAAGIGRIGTHVVPPSVEYSSLVTGEPPVKPSSAFTTKEVVRGVIDIISDGAGTSLGVPYAVAEAPDIPNPGSAVIAVPTLPPQMSQ